MAYGQTEKKYFIATPEGRLVETTDAVIINNHIASATADIEDLLESIEDLENTGNDYLHKRENYFFLGF